MEAIRAAFTRTRERVDSYTLELHRHGLESVEREVRWLNELIASERQAGGGHRDNDFRRVREGVILMGSVRVAIVGVGNCACSLVQGVEYYKDADHDDRVPGLMHVTFGDYHVSDVEFVAAFDVDAKKVGCDLAEAIGASENNTIKICDVPPTGVTVQRGPTFDGLGEYYREIITSPTSRPVDVAAGAARGAGRRARLLPAGRLRAGRPVLRPVRDRRRRAPSSTRCRCSSPPTRSGPQKFTEAGVPIVGDDIKSQVGATITHRVLAKLFEDRGVELLRTYQLNFGGNMDFMNMLERKRLQSKKISKTQSVTSQIPHEMEKRRRAHRPVRPRAVAGRPQVGLRPAGGPRLRRRAAQPGVQARGVGLAELGRASSSTRCAPPRSRWTGASAAR